MSSRSRFQLGADRGEDLGLLDGVDAEVGLEVEVGVEQVGGVAGHLGDDRRDDVEDRVARPVARRRGGRRGRGSGVPVPGQRTRRPQGREPAAGAGTPSRLADPGRDVVQRRELPQLQVVVAHEVPLGADGGEDLGLLDGVDAEVGLEVEVRAEEVGGVAGHLGDDLGDRRRGSGRRRSPKGRGEGESTGDADGRRGDRRVTAELAADPAGDVVQGGEVAQPQGVVALQAPAGRARPRRPRPA